MNVNSIMFIPQMNANTMNGGGPFMTTSPQHNHHGATPNLYQMRHMGPTHFQQPQRFLSPHHSQSPPQRQGYIQYYQQTSNRYYYNSMMAQRPNGPPNTALSGNQNNNNMGRNNYRKSPINYTAQNQKSLPSPPSTNETNVNGNAETDAQNSKDITNEELPKTSDNKLISIENSLTPTKPQQQQQRKNINNNKTEKIETIITKKSTKCTKMKRSDSKSSLITAVTSTKLVVAAAATVKVINTKEAKNRQQQKKQNDTMQRNCSKASHSAPNSASSAKSHQNNKNHNHNNHDSSDSGISSPSSASGQHNQHNNATSAKQQRKARGKRQDAANAGGQQKRSTNTTTLTASATTTTTTTSSSSSSSGFTVNDWLQNDMYCYERRFISSCGEDSRISRHNPAHRNSTSSEAAGSDDLNSSSSYEDHCPTYVIQTKTTKKTTKSRQKRQQKRKQLLSNSTASNATNSGGNQNASNTATTSTAKISASSHHHHQQQPMDIDEDYKENRKPQKQQSSSSASGSMNLRKQCTKAAALKAALKVPKCQMGNALTTSPSSSSVCSSLSSASSTTSINSSISSSACSSTNSSPTASPTVTKRNAEHLKKVAQALVPPLRQYAKLNMNEAQMALHLKQFLIDPNHLQVYGFPVESVHHEGCIEIYKCLPKHMAEEAVTKDNQRHHHHYYGRKKITKSSNVINSYDGLPSSAQWLATNALDSGNGSGDSSPRFTDSDSSDMAEDDVLAQEPVMAFYTPDGVYQIFSEYDNSEEKQCVRCHKMFQVNARGEYQTFDSCSYHWGKLSNVYNGKCYVNIHSCCQGEEFSEGCSQHPLHVWNGCVVGINGPYKDYVHTRPRVEGKRHKHPKIYAIDCEMSYTGLGLEVTKVTVVGYDGSLVYEHFVRPQAEIVDYNTRFSGISEKDLSPQSNNSIKTFAQVQQDLLKLIDADTILIGHGLDNDLRVLRIVHKTIVDTSLVFSHSTGFPYRRSLKNLTKSYLKRDIQCSDMGHSSFEDSRACLELMMWKLRKDSHHHQWSSYQ